ncbi:MAG: Bacterial transferase hexapeptide (Six repeats) [Promethearchaeota archaeon]|nr:MAG: Bacterial transferase hexapeptide (Six repeats) [Candidatus Lokiarchaeota archaeon]
MTISEEKKENNNNKNDEEEESDYLLDFTTSSAISRINIKFLAVYIPVFWLSGFPVLIYWYEYSRDIGNWILAVSMLPVALITMFYIFLFSCLLFSKLLLVLVNLIHKPKEGVFKAEIGDTDFEFWCLRTELKKLAIQICRNSPLPWIDAIAYKLFGVNMDFSSHFNDAWVDFDFINLGKRDMVGQGAVVMSSMVVGKYLVIKKIIVDDYVVIGGESAVAPGTIIGRDSVLGACTYTTYNQILEPKWIYFGIPARKLKENTAAQMRRDVIVKKDVDEAKKFEVEHEVNIDEDKKDLV